MFCVGVDLGQRRDHSAIAVVERRDARRPWGVSDFLGAEVIHAERLQLGTPYPEVVERVRQVLANGRLAGGASLAVDATGVGAPVVEMMRRAGLGCEIAAVTITSGEREALSGGLYHVPKTDLMSGIQVLMERRQLRIAGAMREAMALKRELLSIRAKTQASQGREHDDLAMALALAIWRLGKKGGGFGNGLTSTDGWDPVLRFHCRV